jgi:hypothetical protein
MASEALPMDQTLIDMFDQARKVVADADRRIAEEEDRLRERERESLLIELSARLDDAFDFTSKEKLALEPRLDVQDGVGVVEFVVRGLRAIFLLSPGAGNTWALHVIADGHELQMLSEFQGGTKGDHASRRLAAARIVTTVGDWVQNAKASRRTPAAKPPLRWGNEDESKPEPTFGTMGKFLGTSV